MTSTSQYIADWLLSWMMHATVACMLTLVAGRWLVAEPKLRDLLWKTALLVPLGTSLVSIGISPNGSSSVDLATFVRPHVPLALRTARVSFETTGAVNVATVHVQDALVHWVRLLVLGTILIPAGVATSRLVRRRRRFWKDLRTRQPADAQVLGIDGRALALGRRTVRISVSPQVGSAATVARREICVSPAFATLGRVEQRCVLAHELAHLDRRDLAWIAVADSIACVLAAQPLVRMVARRVRRDAEFICDEIAVRQMGNGAAYARALLVFARRHESTPTTALAYGSSPIIQRAERVLRLNSRYRRAPARIAAALAATVLLSCLLALPRVKTGEASRTVRTQVSAQRAPGSRTEERIHVTVDGR